ncbi:MAG: ABC transporter permease [Verrucomicrobia bacterium]|nr:ABC transporter permease [Verrucomicrobiota bacterium]
MNAPFTTRFGAHVRLLSELVRRDVRARFAGSRFGLLWSLLNPLLQIVSYGLIFGFVYRGGGDVPRGVFVASLFCGLWPWWAFQEGVTRGMTALVDQAPLLKKMPIPPAFCVVSQVAGSALLQATGFLVFLGLFGVLGVVKLSARLVWIPVAAGLGAALATGFGLLLAPIYLVVRDTAHVVNAVLTLLFFASPVLYRIESLPPSVQPLARWNPVAAVIGLNRAIVMGEPISTASLVCLVLVSIAAFAAGRTVLRSLAPILDEYL